jgi:hypothetical protein
MIPEVPMTNNRFKHLLLINLALAAAVAFAQAPRGPHGNPSAPAYGLGLDLTRQQTIEGSITSVQIGYAFRYPSITVNQTTIRLAPVWYLLENDFELAVGDAVRVVAAPGFRDATLHAISVEKIKAGVTLRLRDEAGLPLWTGQPRPAAGAASAGLRLGAGCLDATSIATVTGQIESAEAGAGIQHPTLTLRTGGQLLTFKLGPERIFLQADFELIPGAMLTVRYALATSSGQLIALSLTDASGRTLVLRTDWGHPAWN